MTDAQIVQVLGGLAVLLYVLPGMLPLSGPARYRLQWATVVAMAVALGYALWLVLQWAMN